MAASQEVPAAEGGIRRHRRDTPPPSSGERPRHLETAPHVFLRRWTDSLCRADSMACRAEKLLRALHAWEGSEGCECGAGAQLSPSMTLLLGGQMLWVGLLSTQSPALTERRILAQPKEGARQEVSLPPLGPAGQGQRAPGRRT